MEVLPMYIEIYRLGREYFKKYSDNDEFIERVESISKETGYAHSLDRYMDFMGILIDFIDGVPSGVSGIMKEGYGDRLSSFFVGIVHEKDGIIYN